MFQGPLGLTLVSSKLTDLINVYPHLQFYFDKVPSRVISTFVWFPEILYTMGNKGLRDKIQLFLASSTSSKFIL